MSAREIQRARYAGKRGLFGNADVKSKEMKEFWQIDEAAANLLKTAINILGLSARAYDRMHKVSHAIADLANSANIKLEHLEEAIQYRSLGRNFYNV